MVEQIPVRVFAASGTGGQVNVMVNERAYLECGCSCFVGLRTDNYEVIAAAGWCSPAHEQLIGHFNLLLRESLVEPSQRPLVDVAGELLDQAEQYSGAAAA